MKNTEIKEVITQLVREALTEKKLTKAEKSKREDIVKAMAKQGASKDSKTYAIATAKAKKLNETEEADVIDTITMDVPLFIRMLEYSREDAQGDVDLHDVAENAIALNKEKDYLTIEDYDQLVSSKVEPEDIDKLGKSEKPVYENSNTNIYSNLQKEVLALIMKGDIEIQNYPNFRLSKEENTALQSKGLIPSEIYKTTSGAEYLRFKVNDLKLEDELGKRFVDVPINKEVKARFKDIPSTSKYNGKPVSIYKRSRNMPDERSSD